MNKMLAIASGVLLACGSMAAQAVVIDDMTVISPTQTVSGAPGTATDCAAGVDIGGGNIRCITAELVSGVDNTSSSVNTGRFNHSNDLGNFGIGTADWDFTAAPIDLSGETHINVRFVLLDATARNANVDVTLTVNGASQTIEASPGNLGASDSLSFPIAIGNLDTLVLEIDAANGLSGGAAASGGVDMSVDLIDTTTPPPPPPPVPAISTVGLIAALAGLPVLGAIGIRRRRRDDD